MNTGNHPTTQPTLREASTASLPPQRLRHFGAPSVWLEFSPLAQASQAVNLGQGFPGWNPPDFVTKIAQEMLGLGEYAQYARSAGSAILTKTLARHYAPKLGRTLAWDRNIVVTVGCSEAVLLSFLALVDTDDEVIFFEPAFDIYAGALAMVGGRAVYVPLQLKDSQSSSHEPRFQLDLNALAQAITPRTKALVINSPHNPTGKVFTKDELLGIADLMKKHPQVVVISDEVYEHLVYDHHQHTPIASLPGMEHRTLSLYSAGKTFSVTGWKIGWVIGHETLISRLQVCQQWIVFSVATPLQAAVAHCLDEATRPFGGASTYYEWLRQDYQAKRQILLNHLKHAGLKTLIPEGSFFISVLLDQLPKAFSCELPIDYATFTQEKSISVDPATFGRTDYNFCRQLTLKHKVTAIPYSAFMSPARAQSNLVRFAFCKPVSELDAAGALLAKVRG